MSDQHVNCGLAHWYASHSAVRRLWAVEDSRGMQVIITLEPTHDGDDTDIAWLANSGAWVRELESHLERPVRLALVDEPLSEAIQVVAELCWRDP
jgi:hypothetical protein